MNIIEQIQRASVLQQEEAPVDLRKSREPREPFDYTPVCHCYELPIRPTIEGEENNLILCNGNWHELILTLKDDIG